MSFGGKFPIVQILVFNLLSNLHFTCFGLTDINYSDRYMWKVG